MLFAMLSGVIAPDLKMGFGFLFCSGIRVCHDAELTFSGILTNCLLGFFYICLFLLFCAALTYLRTFFECLVSISLLIFSVFVFWNVWRWIYIVLTSLRRTQVLASSTSFVCKKKVELNLRVINGITADDFVEMIPLPHDLVVAGNEGKNLPIEEGLESLNDLFLTHDVNIMKNRLSVFFKV